MLKLTAEKLRMSNSRIWADYFDQQDIQYAFFSAANAAALQQARLEREEIATHPSENYASSSKDNQESSHLDAHASPPPETENESLSEDEDEDELFDEQSSEDITDSEGAHPVIEEDPHDAQDPRAKVLTVLELEDLFIKSAPDLSGEFFVVLEIAFADCSISIYKCFGGNSTCIGSWTCRLS